MAARHVASAALHIGLDDATCTLATSDTNGSHDRLVPLRSSSWFANALRAAVSALRSGATTPTRVRLLHTLCELAWLLARNSEISAALAMCDWVGSGSSDDSGLLNACLIDLKAHPGGTHRCMLQLGWALRACGRYSAAQQVHELSLNVMRHNHGSKDHSDVATSLWSLAQVYKSQGRLDDSASLQEESLAMCRRIHGSKDHSSVAVSLCSLAQVYLAQGRLDDSASLQEESLAMKRRIHGSKDHSSVAASLCSLAQVYKAQGRLDDSASLAGESLVLARRLHGSKAHSDVAASMCSLAQVYKAQGRLDDSASLHEEPLAMARRIHGSKDHSDVA